MRYTVPSPIACAFAALAAAASPVGQAQTSDGYPSRPLRMIVAFSPGGPTDLVARLLAQGLSEAMGQPVLVDNRPGAGGTVAGPLIARAAPDGHTLFTAANGEVAIAPALYARLPWDPAKDIAPVSRVGASQLVLVVPAAFPAASVKELIALAKAKPGTLNYASSGTGSTAHLSAELLRALAGIDIVHVPYKGAGPALADLAAGQVQLLISGFSSAWPQVRAGRLRALAVTGARRLAAAPDLPTLGETLPGYEVTSWYGVFVPARTPRPIIDRLNRELGAIIRRPDMVERLVAMGIEPEGNSPEAFAGQLGAETQRWARTVRQAGLARQ